MKLKDIGQYWDLLCAAREGKTIQMQSPLHDNEVWLDMMPNTHFGTFDVTEYRIKPEPLVLWVNEYVNGDRYTYDSKPEATRDRAGDPTWLRTIKMQEVAPSDELKSGVVE